MSFDIGFSTDRFTGKLVVKRNPFTGKEQSVLTTEPLTAAEVKAVRAVLKGVGARGPDEHGCYVVEVEDGGTAEVYADKLRSGCMVALRGLTPGLSQFLFDFLKAGNWVMHPAMDGNVAITAAPDSVKGVPDDYPKPVTCGSAKELAVLLGKGVKAWEKYRDQVVSDE